MLWLISQLKSLSLKAMSTVTICPPSPGSTVSLQVCVCACCKCSHMFLLISVKQSKPARVAVLKWDAKKHWTQVMYPVCQFASPGYKDACTWRGQRWAWRWLDRVSGSEQISVEKKKKTGIWVPHQNVTRQDQQVTSACWVCAHQCVQQVLSVTHMYSILDTPIFFNLETITVSLFPPEVLEILDKPVALIPAALP